jgi:hypothetical protein
VSAITGPTKERIKRVNKRKKMMKFSRRKRMENLRKRVKK